jgi:23S rRNA (uridine2552-2'-O)-methyltransferase
MEKFNKKKLSESSKKWLRRSKGDIFTYEAQINNLPCRSYFKLEEIHKKYKIIYKDIKVLDLGSSPGGWSKYLTKHTKNIDACDLLDTMTVDVNKFVLGDFTNPIIQEEFTTYNLIISDIAMNATGNKWMDQCNNNNLAEEVFEFMKNHLIKNGHFVIKLFESEYTHEYVNNTRKHFKEVYKFKPESSYKDSSEIYLIGKYYIN